MRLLFLGDMVGKTGRTAVWDRLPGLVSDLKLDFVIVNGENAAGGFGITEDIFLETINAGADVVTTGNHVWDQKDAVAFAGRHDQFLRPANYPQGTPGRGSGLFYARNGARVLVANIMGRVFMHPELDDPFKSAETILAACPLKEQADAIIFDFHAEATSEKQCFGHFVDGRASFVVGTHTHVPTADAPDPEWRHRLYVGCRHVRRLRLLARHGQGRAAQPLHFEDAEGPHGSGDRPRNHLRRRRRDFRCDRTCGKDRAAAPRTAARRNHPGFLALRHRVSQ